MKIYKSNLFKNVLQLLGYDMYKAINDLSIIKSYDEDQLRSWQNKQKWDIAKFHYQNNPFYKKLVGNYFPDNWNDLPILNKNHFMDENFNFISKMYSTKSLYVAKTSGSSGHALTFFKNKYAHAMDLALIFDRYGWYKLDNKIQARFFGISSKANYMLKEKIKDIIMKRYRFSLADLSEAGFENFIKIFKTKKFDYLYGYTNTLLMFAKYLLSKKITLKKINQSLKFCVVTAELLTEQNRKLLAKSFGLPIINEYGASEIGLVGFDHPSGDMIFSDETLVADSVSIDSNNYDNLIITNLNNMAMPFIKYNIGDLATIIHNPKKNKNKIILNIIGRQNDMIHLPNGDKLPGFSIVKPFDYFLFENTHKFLKKIKEFIFRQNKDKEIILDLVIKGELDKNEVEIIRRFLLFELRNKINVRINIVDKIEKHKSGKLKQFISEI